MLQDLVQQRFRLLVLPQLHQHLSQPPAPPQPAAGRAHALRLQRLQAPADQLGCLSAAALHRVVPSSDV